MIDIGEGFNLDSNDKYTALITLSSDGEADSIVDVEFDGNAGILTFKRRSGATFTKDISDLQTFDVDNNRVLYVNASGEIQASNVEYNNIFKKTSEVTQTVSSKVGFSEMVSFAPIRLNNQPSTSVGEIEKIDIKGVTEIITDSDNEGEYLMTKAGIKKLIANTSTSTGLDIEGTSGNIIIINENSDGVVDSGISADNIMKLDSSENRSISGSGLVGISSRLRVGNGLIVSPYQGTLETKPVEVKYIKNKRSDNFLVNDESISLMTQNGIIEEIENAKIRSLTYIKKVLGAVDFAENEPLNPSDGDRYINTNQSNVPISSETDQAIPANAVCTWDATAGEWSTQEPSLGWSPLNTDTNTYWRLVEDSSGDPVWEDPGTPGDNNDHNVLYNVINFDGEEIAGVGARHLDQASSDLLLGGGEVDDEHTHTEASIVKGGFLPALPDDATKFLNGTGVFSSTSLPDSGYDVRKGQGISNTLEGTTPTINDYSGDIITINDGAVSGVRMGNMFMYDFSIQTVYNEQASYSINLPTSKYTIVAHVSTNYGESIGFTVSNLTSTYSHGNIIYDAGSVASSGSLFTVGYSGADIIISTTANTNTLLEETYGAPIISVSIKAYYYEVPTDYGVVVEGYGGVNPDNLTPPAGNILGADNEFTGANTFTENVTLPSSSLTANSVISSNFIYNGYPTSDFLRRTAINTSGYIIPDPTDAVQTDVVRQIGTTESEIPFDHSKGDTIEEYVTPTNGYRYILSYTSAFIGSEGTLLLRFGSSATDVTISIPVANNVIVGQLGSDYTSNFVAGDELIIGTKYFGQRGWRTVIVKSKYQ